MAGKFSKSRLIQPDPSIQETDAPVYEQTNSQTTVFSPKAPRTGTLIFYTVYGMLILFFILGMWMTLSDLKQELTDFEASQPDSKSSAVFQELFAAPDWAALYDLAGMQDTAFEGRDVFAAYMSQKVGNQPLSYRETSTDLSRSRQYAVLLGDTAIGSFTLVCAAGSEPAQWELSAVELIREGSVDILVRKLSGHTVYVNGVALDDSYTTHIGSTAADEYLPRGVYNVWLHTQHVTGLMAEPVVTATDEMGRSVDVLYDETTGAYTTADSTNTISGEEKELAISTLKAYSQFMVDGFSFYELGAYFDTESDIYAGILACEPWLDSNLDARFSNEAVTGFYRHSDEVFSVRASMTVCATRVNGTQKEFGVARSMVFQKGETGWLCVGITEQDLSQLDQSVRITFMSGDMLLTSEFYDTDISSLTTPLFSPPDGQVMTGWYRNATDENGMTVRVLVFTPDSSGNVVIPEDLDLEPMTLYAQFEDINPNSEVNE